VTFLSKSEEKRWMETVQPTEVTAEDLDPELQEKVRSCELMW
jgi:hypothetical protein